MAKNCRFAVAVHISTLLALAGDKPATSDFIAGSVNTNPVVVRRILSALAKAGLVHSSRGTNGGSVLTKPVHAITLLDISRAVDEEEQPSLHHKQPNQDCPVGSRILSVMTEVLDKSTQASDGILAGITLESVIRSIRNA
jgi:Rrf2 family protein